MKIKLIYIIIFAAAVLRLINLGSGDPISDEATNAFRALGPIDFDAAAAQPTPWEWLDPALSAEGAGQVPSIPWWAHLSLHDHPLLTFYIENISMRIFGETDFAYRLPAAIFGILAVYLLYLLSKNLFNERTALFSAALFAVTVNHIYVSRIGLQESYVIFFILLILYLFWRALENDKKFLWLGAAVGFGLLSKYTVFIAVVIGLIYGGLLRRDIFKNKRFYLAAGLAMLIFSPSIIYNLMLYKTFGHFDFQISHILGNYPESWKIAPGKDIGTLGYRLKTLPINIFKTNSWVFLALFSLSFIYGISRQARKIYFNLISSKNNLFFERSPRSREATIFLIIATATTLALFLKIGTAYRFLTMLTPFAALWAGIGLERFCGLIDNNVRLPRRRQTCLPAGRLLLAMTILPILAFEIFYSVNSQILSYPVGNMPWLYSNLRYENYNWGYNELGEFLNKEFGDKVPALSFDAKYQFLNELKDADIAKAVAAGKPASAVLILYEGNFDFAAKLWYLDRLQIYHGWPVMSFRDYLAELTARGADYFANLGFREYYLIFATNTVPDPAFVALIRNKSFISVLNKRKEEVFKVYKL